MTRSIDLYCQSEVHTLFRDSVRASSLPLEQSKISLHIAPKAKHTPWIIGVSRSWFSQQIGNNADGTIASAIHSIALDSLIDDHLSRCVLIGPRSVADEDREFQRADENVFFLLGKLGLCPGLDYVQDTGRR